ncbi:PREDICTED: DNA repair protein XRCC4 [Nelumbo nucifera]|uniref:DNA repair protein XRCC4 n=1 Tax=Nelumbo nucifera TaxID=4432 RepID=A0A1U8QB93_NELNU|nr:PREDICTED: DNA repair protein XRCC4 [Nelumbo nucifera]
MKEARHTCLRLEIKGGAENERTDVIFVKGTWFESHFDLAITNGLHTWICIAPEGEVRERASQWDQPVSEYIETAERYLGFQQPGSTYSFVDAGNGQKRLSWTFEKQGTKLEWRWKCQPSPDDKKTTIGTLDFLMDANIRLSEEVVRKTQLFERLKVEAEKCLAQSEKFSIEKEEFESAVYAKIKLTVVLGQMFKALLIGCPDELEMSTQYFVSVLNSKKAKLRELRDRLSKQENTSKSPQEEDGSTDKTESYDEESDADKSDEDQSKNLAGTSKSVASSKPSSRKR